MLQGVIPILATPFTDQGTVDLRSLDRLVDFLLAEKVDGIALFGMASEMYTLTEYEREVILQAVVRRIAGRTPIIVGTSYSGAQGAVQFSVQAAEAGAAALMIMPPYVAKPDERRMLEYFSAIADAVDTPIMIQDAPNASGVNMSVALICRLAREIPSIQYVKIEAPPTTTKITALLEQSEGKIAVFGGMNANYLYEELCRGVVGTMPACEFPDVCRKVFDAFMSGNKAEARRLFYRYLPFIRYGTQPGIAMAVHKEILYQGGVIAAPVVRNPNAPIDAATKRELAELISDLDLAVRRCAVSGE